MGRKSKKMIAPAMLNRLRKLELMPIIRYLITLPRRRETPGAPKQKRPCDAYRRAFPWCGGSASS
jgi:hypothetical protein